MHDRCVCVSGASTLLPRSGCVVILCVGGCMCV